MLTGQTILITGAKGALGVTVTRAFLNAGAVVAGVSRTIAQSDIPQPQFHAFPAELSSVENCKRLVGQVTATLGKIDALVHLVGGFAGGTNVADADESVVQQMMDINFRSVFAISRAVLPVFQEQGHGVLLAVASKSALEPSPGSAVYAASKAALVSLVRSIAAESTGSGIRANVVLPGTLDLPANRNGQFSRLVKPETVAEVLVSLAAPSWSQITGAAIPITAGEL